MPKPRIFISSTYYDLKQSREDLEEFIKNIGYEPVLSERGDITYGKEKELEEYCYKEIENCEMLVALIGGKFGSSSRYGEDSITQKEIKTALNLNKQVYIFIKKEVNIEFETYMLNKDNQDMTYKHVDNIKIYNFIENIKSLKRNNPIFDFETMKDVIFCLKKQWAGLFYDLLNTPPDYSYTEELMKELAKIKEDNTQKGEEPGSLISGELLKIQSWHHSQGNEKILKTDIDGDGKKETIVFGRHAPIGTKLQVLIGKDIFELGYLIEGLDEDRECGGSSVLAIKDVTNDGYPEILFAFYGEMLTAHLNIFKFDKERYLNTPRGEQLNPFKLIGYIVGQLEFRVLNGGRIEIPYGSHGLYDTYIWNGKKFIPDYEVELFKTFKSFIEAFEKNEEYEFFDSATKDKLGTKRTYIKNKKNHIFKKFETYQSEGVEFKDNKTILKLSGTKKDDVNNKVEFTFYFNREGERWKIDFIKTKEKIPDI